MLKLVISLFVFAVFVYLGSVFSGCADGWASSSIGNRGACSHHGGVSSIPLIFSIIGVVSAVFTYILLSTKSRK